MTDALQAQAGHGGGGWKPAWWPGHFQIGDCDPQPASEAVVAFDHGHIRSSVSTRTLGSPTVAERPPQEVGQTEGERAVQRRVKRIISGSVQAV
ncbi:hypothetical protein WCLP8_200020 [uncultured Gammaproteobacteria bacterium]